MASVGARAGGMALHRRVAADTDRSRRQAAAGDFGSHLVSAVPSGLHVRCHSGHIPRYRGPARHGIGGVKDSNVQVEHVHVDGKTPRLERRPSWAAKLERVRVVQLHPLLHQQVHVPGGNARAVMQIKFHKTTMKSELGAERFALN